MDWRKKAGFAGFAVAGAKLRAAAQRSHIETASEFELLAKKCKTCEVAITYENRRNDFCSRSCGAKHNNRLRVGIRKLCRCGKVIQNKALQCRACSITNTIEKAGSDKTRKGVLIRKHGHQCMLCRNTEWNNAPIPLELDHMDGDSDNNQESNLRVICPNCHAQTDTYKAKNKLKGSSRKLYRKMRLERANRTE